MAFSGPGPGRPKGALNKRTLEQRAFAERVCYGQDGKGRVEFEEFTRKQLLSGMLSPQIWSLILFYLIGKPAEHIEMKDVTDASDISAADLEKRMSVLSGIVSHVKGYEDSPDNYVKSSEDVDTAVH